MRLGLVLVVWLYGGCGGGGVRGGFRVMGLEMGEGDGGLEDGMGCNENEEFL